MMDRNIYLVEYYSKCYKRGAWAPWGHSVLNPKSLGELPNRRGVFFNEEEARDEVICLRQQKHGCLLPPRRLKFRYRKVTVKE